jgi:hypothetical protein
MKTLGQLHVFGVAKLVMVVLFDSKKFKKTIKLNESGQKEPSLMICPHLVIFKKEPSLMICPS